MRHPYSTQFTTISDYLETKQSNNVKCKEDTSNNTYSLTNDAKNTNRTGTNFSCFTEQVIKKILLR